MDPRISRITVRRLYNLGSYEHVSYELSIDVPYGHSAETAIVAAERLLVGLDPKPIKFIASEADIAREEVKLKEAEAMTDEQFRDYRNYRDYSGTRDEIIQRLKDAIREKKEKRDKVLTAARKTRELFDDLGGAEKFSDAKLDWEDNLDDY